MLQHPGLVSILVLGGVISSSQSAWSKGTTPPQWVELGGSASGGGLNPDSTPSMSPRMVVDGQNRPFIVWYEDGASQPDNRIFGRRWDGNQWEEIGSSGSGSGVFAGPTVRPAVALDGSGNPVVAWINSEYSGYAINRERIHVRRWTGSDWETLPGSAADGGVTTGLFQIDCVRAVSVAVDPSGVPWLAWQEGMLDPQGYAFIARWNGSSWAAVGGSMSDGGIGGSWGALDPRIAFGPNGNPVVAWAQATSMEGPREVRVRTWNGSAWTDFAGSGSVSGISDTPWIHSSYPDLRVDASNNPVVAWIEGTNASSVVHMRRWDGTDWVEVGGSASNLGVSGVASVDQVSLDLDTNGNPVVAFSVGASNSVNEICVRRWNGQEWEGVDESDSERGISASDTGSDYPKIIAGPSGDLFVCWQEFDGPVREISMRRWISPKVAELEQRVQGSDVPLGPGGISPATFIELRGVLSRPGINGPLVMQVEVRPATEPFQGLATLVSTPVAPGETALVTHMMAGSGSWKWRARTVSEQGTAGPWISFGSNPDLDPDFIYQAPQPPPIPAPMPTVGGGGGGGGGRGCGLTGLEALAVAYALVAGLRRLRRRRA